jgi:hypothetical protein
MIHANAALSFTCFSPQQEQVMYESITSSSEIERSNEGSTSFLSMRRFLSRAANSDVVIFNTLSYHQQAQPSYSFIITSSATKSREVLLVPPP